ncbi:MAG: hypothetical protein H0U44_06715 [Flavisolibacter sp.]|nr:hypothetical protein [Flavisolibacter sp.]
MNGTQIYALVKDKPIVVRMPTNPSRIVVTDGFHITHPLEISYSLKRTYYFKIVCGIENDQLLVGLILAAIVYMMGLTSGILFLQLLSITPILYFLFIYYIKRKEFIQIRPV